MISGLARAGRAFGDADDVNCASRAAEFVLIRLRDAKNGQLLRRYRDAEARGAAFLDDYAFFVAGLLDLFEASQNPRWLHEAIRLTEEQIQVLWDEKGGGFYFAGADDPRLLLRPKSDFEGSEPSGNSVAALNLLRLAQLTDRSDYRDRAEGVMKSLSGNIRSFAASMPLLLCAFSDSLSKPRQIVIAGDPSHADVQALWREVNERYLPNTVFLAADGGRNQAELAKRLPFLAGMKPLNGRATAYVCQDYVCQAPTTDLAVLRKILVAIP